MQRTKRCRARKVYETRTSDRHPASLWQLLMEGGLEVRQSGCWALLTRLVWHADGWEH